MSPAYRVIAPYASGYDWCCVHERRALYPPPPPGGRKREVKLVVPSGVIGIHCVLKSNCGMRITLLIRSAFTSCNVMEGCVVGL